MSDTPPPPPGGSNEPSNEPTVPTPPPGGAATPPPPGGAGTPPPPGASPPPSSTPPTGGGGVPPSQWGQSAAPPSQPAPYGTPGAPAAPYGAPVQQASTTNGMAVAALVLGILALLGSIACGAGILFGIIAVILGVLGRKKANEELNGTGAGMATGGIVMGAIGIVLSVLAILWWTVWTNDVVTDFGDDLGEINSDPSDGECNTDRFLQDPDC